MILAICEPGYEPNATNTAECIACEIGYYSAVNASDPCVVCPNNYTTEATGSMTVSECKCKFFIMKTP